MCFERKYDIVYIIIGLLLSQNMCLLCKQTFLPAGPEGLLAMVETYNETINIDCTFRHSDLQWCYILVAGVDNSFHRVSYIDQLKNNYYSSSVSFTVDTSGVYNVLIYAVENEGKVPTKLPNVFTVLTLNVSSTATINSEIVGGITSISYPDSSTELKPHNSASVQGINSGRII